MVPIYIRTLNNSVVVFDSFIKLLFYFDFYWYYCIRCSAILEKCLFLPVWHPVVQVSSPQKKMG